MTEDELFELRQPGLDMVDMDEIVERKKERLAQMEARLKRLKKEAEESYQKSEEARQRNRQQAEKEAPE